LLPENYVIIEIKIEKNITIKFWYFKIRISFSPIWYLIKRCTI